MSDEIDLHNALRDARLLPPHLDLAFSQCPTKHVEFMESLAEDLGIGTEDRVAELESEIESFEARLIETRGELESVEKHDADLDKQYQAVCKELEKLKATSLLGAAK